MPTLVLLAGTDPTATFGGHSSYVRAYAHAARAAGFEPHVFALSASPSVEETAFGVVHRVAGRLPVRQFEVGRHVPGLAAAASAFAAENTTDACVLHGFGPWTAAAWPGTSQLREAGRRVGVVASAYRALAHEWRLPRDTATFEADEAEQQRFAAEQRHALNHAVRVEQEAFAAADRVVVNYEVLARTIRAVYPDAAPVEVCPYTTDQAFVDDVTFGAAGERHEPRVPLSVLCVARSDWRKGVGVLLRAVALLRDQGLRVACDIVGDGPLGVHDQALARQLDLGRYIRFAGEVRDVGPYLRRAEVFALPSTVESSGSVALIEAMQAGLAVVASGCDGIPEDVVDGRDGLLVEPGSATDLAAALERLASNTELRRELRAAARRRFDERFSPLVMSAAVADVYERVLSGAARLPV